MAKRKSRRSTGKSGSSSRSKSRATFQAPLADEYDVDEYGIETTGNSIVTFREFTSSSMKSCLATLRSQAGVANVCHSSDFTNAEFSFEDAEGSDAVVFDELGIAVIAGLPGAGPLGGDTGLMATMSGVEDSGMIVEPEYVNYSLLEGFDDDVLEEPGQGDEREDRTGETSPGSSGTPDYLRGYKDGVGQLAEALSGASSATAVAASVGTAGIFNDTRSATWGLHASRVLQSPSTGRGIRVAVLDTGMDLRHPDFRGRGIRSRSFVFGESVQDRNGHGTHCIGTSCGPKRAGMGPRYGVAYEAEIFAGKVLSNAGSGSDGGILGGINWAVKNRCAVISMSLGRPTRPGERPMQSYEEAGRRAIRAGSLILAAAGNSSNRPFVVNPVGSPANASLIAAVAAVDSNLAVARFSDAGINPSGGEVNFAGPGVNVHSSWPMPQRYRTISGTSMATPHLAGIAALIAQENSAFRGVALYREVRRRLRRLRLPRRDVGNGLGEAV